MATDPFATDAAEHVHLSFVSLGALVGGVVAFAWSGAADEVLWTLLGVVVGLAAGWTCREALRAGFRRVRPVADVVERHAGAVQQRAFDVGHPTSDAA